MRRLRALVPAIPALVAVPALLLAAPLPSAAQAGGEGAMAVIPAGSYTPLYTTDGADVDVPSFRLDRHQVTRGEYEVFVRSNPRWRSDRVKPVFADARYLAGWAAPTEQGGNPDAPVTNVSWFAARAYCQAQGKRLPSVHEWEYVARADETREDASRDPAFRDRLVQLYTRRPAKPPAVGSIYRNRFGVDDMHGLVWEWVRDFNTIMFSSDSRGTGARDAQLYCAAGADGASDKGDYAAFLRYAFRASLSKGSATASSLGFRCAADISNAEGGR